MVMVKYWVIYTQLNYTCFHKKCSIFINFIVWILSLKLSSEIFKVVKFPLSSQIIKESIKLLPDNTFGVFVTVRRSKYQKLDNFYYWKWHNFNNKYIFIIEMNSIKLLNIFSQSKMCYGKEINDWKWQQSKISPIFIMYFSHMIK